MQNEPPRILVTFDLSLGYGRSILLGVTDYINSHRPWRLFSTHPFLTLPHVSDISRWKGDGMVLFRQGHEANARAKKLKIPCVFATSDDHNIEAPRVYGDGREAGKIAARHLVTCRYAHYAFCPRPVFTPVSKLREDGFREALAEFGRTCKSLSWPKESHVLSSLDARRKVLEAWLPTLATPVGIFAFNDPLAWLIADVCRDVGLRIPEDVGVIGVDNDELICSMQVPTITSVDPNNRRIGFEAAALLDSLLLADSAGEAGSKKRGRRTGDGGGSDRNQTAALIPPRGVVQRKSTDVLIVEDEAIRDAIHFIRENVSRQVTVEEVVDVVPMCRRSLELRFRSQLGHTISEEVRRQRLRRACELLANTVLPLKQVAAQAGYPDANQMGLAFRKWMAVSPGAYRRRAITEGRIPVSSDWEASRAVAERQERRVQG